MGDVFSKLIEKTGYPETALLRKIMETAITPEEGEFLLALPASNADLSAKFNIDEKEVEAKIDNFVRRGLVWGGSFAVTTEEGGAQFIDNLAFLRDEMLACEFIHPELPALWKEYYEGGFREDISNWLCGLGTLPPTGEVPCPGEWVPYIRVVPAQKAVPEGVELLPYEDTFEIIKAAIADGKTTALRECSCRIMQKECERPVETCIQFGVRGEYALARGGKALPLEELLENQLKAEDEGLVPTIANIADINTQFYICNCCSCCCIVLNGYKVTGLTARAVAKSRFEAEIDQEECIGCQTCLDRCHFDAIDMVKVPGTKKLKAEVDPDNCYGCGLCVLKCETDAISLKVARPPEHIPSHNPNLVA